ncbi:hypothetical protein [Leucobacter tenebrionis]|uniref:hypothetical protein n=1 Tax=Leucobacter tenebrionis TaxID=2873270 RepID=UPI001CA6CBFC|nr:hypothetical protein [Leucobacter tenebrionis]QZY51941.1 hypothetical protein KVY00_00120 [Leucobacter tenebrionis]
MRFRWISAAALAGLLALSGCSGSASNDSEQPRTEDTQSQSRQAAEDTAGAAPTGDPESDDDSAEPKLVLDTGEKTVIIEPTDVYCSGEVGKLQHIIGKTNNGLPLVEAEGDRFVMVKIEQGRPYKANDPDGVAVGDDSVTFDRTRLGSATLEGTMTCTAWED